MRRTLAFACAFLLLVTGCSAGPVTSADSGITLQAALAQLDGLPTPQGASPAQFAELKQALRSALLARVEGKFTSAAPKAAAGAVNDLALTIPAGGGADLSWTYRNKGDYDQNRQVTIGDLSALGANLGKTTASPDWLTKAVACDGDGNGEVNIADITPIGANLFATVAGYKIETTDTPGNAASWHEFDEVTFETSAAPAGSALRTFSHNFAPSPGGWYRVVPFDGTSLGQPSNEVQYSFSAPDITAVTPLSGDAGTAATFIASNAGGTVQFWSWDFGGGAAPSTSSNTQPAVTLGTEGVYNASVTATNAAGSDTFNFTLTVTLPAAPVIDDVQPQSGSQGAGVAFTATLSGGAVATYAWDFGGGATPDTSGNITPFVTLGAPGIYPASLTVSNAGGSDTFNFNLLVTPGINNPPTASFTATPQNGNPGDPVALDASASSDSDGSIVKYEWDLDGDGSYELEGGVVENTSLPSPEGTVDVSLRVTDNWGATGIKTVTLSSVQSNPVDATVIDSWDNANFHQPQLFEVNGNPAVVYKLQPDTLRFLRANDPNGASWGLSQQIAIADEAGTFVEFPRVAIVNGKPAVAYVTISSGNRAVFYKQANDANGDTWGNAIPVALNLNVAAEGSLAVIEGQPAIAFKGMGSNTKYVRALDEDGLSWGTPVTCGIADANEWGVTLAVVNGKPAVGFISNSGGIRVLSYNLANDTLGSNWPSQLDVRPLSAAMSAQSQPFLTTTANGNPAMVYVPDFPGELFFIRALDVEGQSWDAPVFVNACSNGDHAFNMTVISGVPQVLYLNASTDLNHQQADDQDGSSWSPAQLVSSTATDWGVGLSEINGGTAMVWHEVQGSVSHLWYRKLN